jgi:hypothetical protein
MKTLTKKQAENSGWLIVTIGNRIVAEHKDYDFKISALSISTVLNKISNL